MITSSGAKLIISEKIAAYITNWSIDISNELGDIAVLGKTDKEVMPLGQGWTASAEGLIIPAQESATEYSPQAMLAALHAAHKNGNIINLKFAFGNKAFVGEAIIETLSVDTSAGEIPKVSISVNGVAKIVMEDVSNVPTA